MKTPSAPTLSHSMIDILEGEEEQAMRLIDEREDMKKKGYVSEDQNFFKIPSDNPFLETAFVHIIGDKVFIEDENDSICLSIDQAKRLTYFLNDRIVRVVDFGED